VIPIFLEAGSFRSKIDLGMDRLLATNNGICFGKLCNTNLPTTNSYRWYKDNSLPYPGESQPSYTVTGPGTYKVELDVPLCYFGRKIEYTPETVLNNTT
jgi:hypothetical protein